jgi:hypothetical protein
MPYRALLSVVMILVCAAPAQARRRQRLLTAYDRYQAVARSAVIAQDGTVEFRIPSWVHWRAGSSIFAFGSDGNFREEKRAFLEETFEQRAAMGAIFRHRAARSSLRELSWRARAIWCDPARPLAERKQLLYMLWTDAAEPEDEELGGYGQQARAILERFIEDHAPEGSPEGYTLGELQRFNAGRGRAPHFDPYAPGAGAVEAIPPEPEHVDALESEAEPAPELPSEQVIGKVAHALGLAPDERRARLFVAWDDAVAEGSPTDAAYVAGRLREQGYGSAELLRYAALRGDDAFTRAAR